MVYYVCLLITIIGITYLSYQDIKYREVKHLYFYMILYIPSLIGAGQKLGYGLDLFLGFLYLALMGYIVQIIYEFRYDGKIIAIGGADILMAPIYTVWFGLSGCPYLIIPLAIITLIVKFKPVFNLLSNTKIEGGKNTPFLLVYQLAFSIGLIIQSI